MAGRRRVIRVFAPRGYRYEKILDAPPAGNVAHRVRQRYAAGARSCLCAPAASVVCCTKGSERAVAASLPRFACSRRTLGAALVAPGFNHHNWYHLIVDIAWQSFLARRFDITSNVVLPRTVERWFPGYTGVLAGLGTVVNTYSPAWEAVHVEDACVFDIGGGRLGPFAARRRAPDLVAAFYHAMAAGFPGTGGTRIERLFSTRRAADVASAAGMRRIEADYEARGYTVVDFGAMPLEQQVSAIRGAREVAGFHGANLANLVFAERCESVEEIVYSPHRPRYTLDFESISVSKGIAHRFRFLDDLAAKRG